METQRPLGGNQPPIKTLAQRLSYVALVLGVFALMLLGKADAVLMDSMRAHVIDAVAPIVDVLSRPVSAAANLADNVSEFFAMRDENARLRADREKLRKWEAVARQLEAENKSLRALMNFVPPPEANYITARVIASSKGEYVSSVVINAGEKNSVRKGQAVVTGEGLVGRVQAVGANSALVLLVKDLNSRIPVRTEASRIHAIFAGDNENPSYLDHLPPGAVVEEGDRVVTSGDGGAFPPGIPVGVIASVSGTKIRVDPLIDLHRLEYVRVIDYRLDGIISLPETSTFIKSGNKNRR